MAGAEVAGAPPRPLPLPQGLDVALQAAVEAEPFDGAARARFRALLCVRVLPRPRAGGGQLPPASSPRGPGAARPPRR